jgi:hypothetical protein
MSGSRVRRTIVLALVLIAGSLPVASAGATQASRADRDATVRQEGAFRTLMGSAWNLLQSVLGKEPHSSDKAAFEGEDVDLGEGPTICPLGFCIPPR